VSETTPDELMNGIEAELLAGQGTGRPGCGISIMEQVQSLQALEDGWLDGEGRAYS
jgi:hypothetical protein